MLARQRRDQLLDDDGLAHAGATDHADLAPTGERRDEVDHLDAGLEDHPLGHLLAEARRGPVDGKPLRLPDGSAAVDRPAQHVEDAPQHRLTDRGRDRAAGVRHRLAAAQPVGGVHRHAAHLVVAEVLLHLQHQRLSAVLRLHLQGVVDLRQLAGRELGVDDRAHDLGDGPGSSLCHALLQSVSVGYETSASAPPTMSNISVVMASCRALL